MRLFYNQLAHTQVQTITIFKSFRIAVELCRLILNILKSEKKIERVLFVSTRQPFVEKKVEFCTFCCSFVSKKGPLFLSEGIESVFRTRKKVQSILRSIVSMESQLTLYFIDKNECQFNTICA